MATQVVNGNKVLIYVEGVAIGCMTNATFSSTNEEIETTCKDDDGAFTSQSGTNRWTITGEGNFAPLATFSVDDLLDVHMSKDLVTVAMRDTTSGGNNLTITGEARLDVFELTAGLNAAATYSFTFNGQGAYTKTNT